MAMKPITLSGEQLLEALTSAVAPLWFPSETDAPIQVLHFPADSIGESFTEEALFRLVYPNNKRSQFEATNWAEMHRWDSTGTQNFFRRKLDIISIQPDNTYEVAEYELAQRVPQWRLLYNLLFDNTIARKWFRIEHGGSNAARKDIYAVGRHLQVQVDEDSNEVITQPGDWFLLATYVIET